MSKLSYKVNDAYKRVEKMPVSMFEDADDAVSVVAGEIADLIRAKQAENKNCILGFPTGSTPVVLFAELVKMHEEEGLSFSNVITFNTDEYYPMDPEMTQSYNRFMRDHLYDFVDIKPENINVPDGTLSLEEVGQFCKDYDRKIRELGGIDLQVLGIGGTGDIGFNEPGSYMDSPTRLITLDSKSRSAAASDFFSPENVPSKAITIGIGPIMEADRVIVMAWGEGKAGVVKKAVEEEVTEMVPVSFLQQHPRTTLVVDTAAAAELKRNKTPWLLGKVNWTEKMVRKAVVWLCQEVDKPILKLTNRDYNDNGLSDLAAEFGSAYQINIKVFNDLQHTITGWPGGKPDADDTNRPERADPFPKKSIIFSPHPDDDVISMGGTFIRLVDHGNDVHVAYQTSGNIAVFDDDVVRFADFALDYHDYFIEGDSKISRLYNKVRDDIRNKVPATPDSEEVRKLKAIIRKGEAKAACRFVGIPDENVHFLDLPFYETGAVKKNPVGDDDVKIIVDVLRELKPQQIFAAGDLSDPHGTHRVCLEAIFMALDELKDDDWISDCWVWLYRGAWQEWGLDEVEMAVPLSPDEVGRKRKAIFKHQSQKDSALFPGSDAREFWQRAEDRNHETAVLYDKLGMAEYEAFEAFVRWIPESWKK